MKKNKTITKFLALMVALALIACVPGEQTVNMQGASLKKVEVKAATTKKQKTAAYNKKAKKEYMAFLKKVKKKAKKGWDFTVDGISMYVDINFASYSICDVNNDGKLELLFYPFGGTDVGDEVYCYRNKKITHCGMIGKVVKTYKDGVIYSQTGTYGSSYHRWDKIKNGKVVSVASCCKINEKVTGTCYINKKKVSVSKMKKFIKKRNKKKTVKVTKTGGLLKKLKTK